MAKKKEKSEIDLLGEAGLETVEDYFNALNAGFVQLNDLRKKQERKLAEEQKTYMTQMLAKEAEMRKALGIKTYEDEKKHSDEIEAYRRKLLSDFEKEKRKKEIEIATAVAKAQAEADPTMKGRQLQARDRQREREESHKQNMELYLALRSIDKDKRTPEQNKALQEISAELRKEGGMKALRNTLNNLVNSLNKLNTGIDKYASYSGKINARLQGYNTNANGWEMFRAGVQSFGTQPFSILENRIASAVGVQPYFKTEEILDNLQKLVGEGIASNVEQRAFLQTAKDGIATTFDVANGALLRIIKLQQTDSTAARLGMEAYLTKFLNQMYENTEYLQHAFDTVSESLVEASSQYKNAGASAEFEYVVQKWLGSLSSVGFSDQSVQSIAQALGYLGSGDIESLNSSNLQNLLVMSASRKGLSYADMLKGNLTPELTDALMRSMVEYMVEIGGSSNNVVRSQFAKTFGLSVSDLRAAQNLSSSLDDIASSTLNYTGMFKELESQMGMIPGRLNTATMLDNLWSNLEFGLASNIAKNPALAAIWKVTGLIEENTGGINIPFVEAMGTGFDLNTTVENLVKLGVVGVSSLGMIGDLVSGVGSTFAPSSILDKLGITPQSQSTTISRGTGLGGNTEGGFTSSLSAMNRVVANSSGEDISQTALSGANDQARETVKQESDEEATNALPNIKKYLTETLEDHMVAIQRAVEEMNSKMDTGVEVRNSTIESGPGGIPVSDLIF